VKPAPFEYHAPRALDDALALLAQHGDDAKVLAGGQSLVPLLALRLAAPAHLVDIGAVGDLQSCTVGEGIEIGAGVTQRALERMPSLPAAAPLLAEVIPLIAHAPIRNRGTVCGSLAHADPAAELPAAMLALDAVMVVRGPRGERRVPAAEFFTSYLSTVVEPDELLVRVDVPPWPAGAGWAFLELTRRSGDFAIVGVAVVLRAHDAVVSDVRVACCGVASTPVRLANVERALLGQSVDAHTIDTAAAQAGDEIDPPADVHAPARYRREMTSVLVRRALTLAASRVEVRR
jgi:carbon-monoxide dehydrogenase medium subunit